MGLLTALLLEPAGCNVSIVARADGIAGSGTAQDPFNGATRRGTRFDVALSYLNEAPQEALASTAPKRQGFVKGDVVEISGVTGDFQDFWNGTFGIYGVSDFGFKYFMKKPLPPSQPIPGKPKCFRLTFPFDEVMRKIPPNARIELGPGVYQTRGFGTDASGSTDERGVQAKSGWKIVGAGIDVTTLQLVGADKADYHYHAMGMPIYPTGTERITPLEHFEISDLTLDCNADNQPGRPDPGYAPVACGAVRILGNHCQVRGIKAINWGTKSPAHGCFVMSLMAASGEGQDSQGHPLATTHSGIEDCILVSPSPSSYRETTVLHVGGAKNPTSQVQGFGTAPYIRRNFVDCAFTPAGQPVLPMSSLFITAASSGTARTGHPRTWP